MVASICHGLHTLDVACVNHVRNIVHLMHASKMLAIIGHGLLALDVRL